MIDVILCCYNQQKTITQALESIYNQEINEEINLIIADDKSKDKTLEIIKATKNPSDRITLDILEASENLGLVKNYQRAFSACKGEFVLILEGDDWWCSPNHIKQHVDFFFLSFILECKYKFVCFDINRLICSSATDV